MILWDHVTYKTCFISTCTRSMDTKYGKVVTYHEVLPFTSSYDHLHKCSWEVMWQIKYVLSPLQKTNKHQTRQGVILPWQATPLKSQDHLITWNNVRSNYNFLASKLGKEMTSMRRFRAQTPKSPLTSYSSSLFPSHCCLWTDWQKFFRIVFVNCYSGHVWPVPD